MEKNERNKLIELLENLRKGKLSYGNFSLEDFEKSNDRSVSRIWLYFCNILCDDLHPFSTIRPTYEQEGIIRRSILFLKKDNKYYWPDLPDNNYKVELFFLLLTIIDLLIIWSFLKYLVFFVLVIHVVVFFLLHRCIKRFEQKAVIKWENYGDIRSWPFISEDEYQTKEGSQP